ncbi:MAG: hypothetical protein JXM72_01735 [Deltaproteobacteria bacterium]|nr:hypothetical protein [Deltaproteobacteria bacterium]
MEVTVIPSIWTDLRVDFFIGMIIGQIIYIPFSQGFPFIILSALILQAFSGARIGLIPLIYILVFLSLDMIKNLVYFENVYTQMMLGFVCYLVLICVSLIFTGSSALEGKALSLLFGAILSGAISPAMVYIVCRLQTIYES